jgi:hypothetical protein
MRKMRVGLLMVSAVFLCGLPAYSQDSPSLGDVARQAREQREKAKTANSQNPQAARMPNVITNEDMPKHSEAAEPPSAAKADREEAEAPSASDKGKMSAEYWKARIQEQKSLVHSLQSRLDQLGDSIHFAPGNCVRNCVQWNERQKQKQQEAVRLQSQLDRAQKNLDRMQEAARRQGYGNSVYDP